MDDPLLARRYDPLTEEVSSNSIDHVTVSNLMEQVRSNQIDRQRIICYRDVISQMNEAFWYDLTTFITTDFLAKFRNLQHGNKVVPGAYEFDGDNDDIDTLQISTMDSCVDGTSIQYPPIPVFANDIRVYRHLGTRRFLQSLNPSLRTSFCLVNNGANSANKALDIIVNSIYEQQWEYLLGDIQLSFVLFLHLHCYNSYTYWRDAIVMISAVDATAMKQHMCLYSALFHTVSVQIKSIDNDEGLFSDIDVSHDDNFLLPSLEQLLSTASKVHITSHLDSFTASLLKLKAAMKVTFSSRILKTDGLDVATDCVSRQSDLLPMVSERNEIYDTIDTDDEDDEDAPVIVCAEEIEASLTRSHELENELNRFSRPSKLMTMIEQSDRELLRQQYPLLLAAMDSSCGKEDIMMTCARVLSDAVDVSVVREAAAYLEDIESKKTGNGNV